MIALAGQGFAHVWQPAGQVTAAGVVAMPEVRAPAGQGFSHDSHPAGHVTAVDQSTAADVATGASVTTGASVMTAADDDHKPLFWGSAEEVVESREIERRMRESVDVCDCCMVIERCGLLVRRSRSWRAGLIWWWFERSDVVEMKSL